MQLILEKSSLARLLMDIYNAFDSPGPMHVLVNSSVYLSLDIPNVHLEKQGESFPTLRPYQTLLLLYEREEIMNQCPNGSSPLLLDLIQKVDPLLNFEEMQTLLNIPLSQIYKLAAHLVFWKKARVIDTVSIRNVYSVNPKADLNHILHLDFSTRFPNYSLFSLLSILSLPRPLSSILPSKNEKTEYLDMIIYLLKHDLVTQIHMYFCMSFFTL